MMNEPAGKSCIIQVKTEDTSQEKFQQRWLMHTHAQYLVCMEFYDHKSDHTT
jgi:hypothetical protein